MITLNCLAVDDESLALDLLEDNIRKVPFLHLAKRCKNATEARKALESEDIDLLFLDIQMPGMTGLQLVESLSSRRPMIVFVTAYESHALEGFNLDVVDYLLKPVAFERFLKAAHKAQELYLLRRQEVARPPAGAADAPPEYIFVNADYSLVKIRLSEVLYICLLYTSPSPRD